MSEVDISSTTMGDDTEKPESTTVPAAGVTVTDRSKEILAMTDEDFQRHTWDQLKEIICSDTRSW